MNHGWTLGAVALALVAAPAAGDENSGLYLGAGLGDYSSEIRDFGDTGIDFDADSDATKLFAGWRFNRLVAVQVEHIDFGDSTTAFDLLEVETETRGFAPYLVGTLPLGPVELFAKAGMLFYDLELVADGTTVFDDSGEEIVYGAGIGVTPLDRLALRLDYEVIEIDEVEEAEAVWLTAGWRF